MPILNLGGRSVDVDIRYELEQFDWTRPTWGGEFINATVSDGGETVSLSQFIIIPIILCLFGFLVGYLSYRKVDQKDLL